MENDTVVVFPEEAKTDWYPETDKPVRKGWYETRFGPYPGTKEHGPIGMLFWDGGGWMRPSSLVEGLLVRSLFGRYRSSGVWRGLKEEFRPNAA